jgi:hypothetical protein
VSTNGGSTATFTDLAISGALGSRTLIFSSGTLTPAESNPINLTTGPPATIGIQAGNNQEAQAGTVLPTDPAVIIRDSGGNPVSGVQVTFDVTGGGGSVNPPTATTGASGIAATNWTLGGEAGPNQLNATSTVGSVTFNATGTALGSSTQLSVEPASPVDFGTTVTLTATVTGSAATPTGVVEFFREGTVSLGTATLNASGIATLQTSTLPAGVHSITAAYAGNATYSGSTSPAISYTVNESNTPPEVGLDNFFGSEDATLNQPAPGVLANDSDADGDALTAQLIGPPATSGEVVLNSNGSFTYTPDSDFNGSDQFSYRASDGEANSAIATVTVTVSPVNDDPTFTPGGDIEVTTLEALAFSDQWASGVDPGPPDESAQALDFDVTLDSPADAAIFPVPPQISDDGTLTFSAVPLTLIQPRVVPLTVVLSDEQGGSTDPFGFSITITPALAP